MTRSSCRASDFAVFLAVDLRDVALLPTDVGAFVLEVLDFLAFVFVAAFFLAGTFPPAFRASDKPIAIACLRLFTVLPERPLFNVPRLRSRIAFSTLLEAFAPYFAMAKSPLNYRAVKYSHRASLRQ
jgi:hypothetical protein